MRFRREAVCSLLLAVSILMSGSVLAQEDAEREERSITVRGVAEIIIPPDHATLRVRLFTANKDVERAFADSEAKAQQIVSAMRELGLAEGDVCVDFPSLQNPYGKAGRGFGVQRTMTIVLRDLSKYNPLIVTVLKDGFATIEEIALRASDEMEKTREARKSAVWAARQKAQYLAERAGQKVGNPLWIVEIPAPSESWKSARSKFGKEIGYAREEPGPLALPDVREGSVSPSNIVIRATVGASFELLD